jgi:glycosyltransferase involved in cell wall biosynthesis
VKLDELCRGKTALNELGICPPEIFEKQVNFCPVDMNNIPPHLKQGEFDFIWSSCAFEHIGSIEHGLRFVKEAMKCVKPGGLAIHTTEFNCSSNQGTINTHNLVFFRLRDIQMLIKELELEGYRVHPIDYYLGDNDYDIKPMREPHNPPAPHLKIEFGGYVATSLLLMIENPINHEVKNSLPVHDSSQNQSGLIKILYDISVLGYGHYDPRSRTGVARVIENIALGLVSSPEFDLSFCGTRSLFAANACLDYLETQPKLNEIAFHHSSFMKILYHQLMEIYQLTEIPENLANNIILNTPEKPLIQHIKKSLSYSLNLFTEAPSLLEEEILQQSDIFHATFFSVPPQIRNFKKLKVFATIYDLIPIILSHLFKDKNDADYQRMLLSLQSLRPDDYILCISHATREDLLNHVKLDPARVFVTHLAANPQMFYPCYDRDQMTKVRKKYGIPNAPYILGVSTLEPRKNLDLVIRSFAHVVQQEKLQDINLVLVGPKGWEYNKIFEEVANFGIAKERIIITGYVADEDLAPLYSGALVFIYPSLYEGFGLPPLEAMQCGVPVITSNNSSLPEVVGDAGIMLDPNDETGVCQNILKLYYSQSLRQEMSAKSLQQARKFTWERCTQETIAAYKIALSS